MSYGEPELSPQVVSQWLANEQATNRELRAEIERLKALIVIDQDDLDYRSCFRYQVEANKKLAELITELADALEAKTSCVEDDDIALVKRAKEAIK